MKIRLGFVSNSSSSSYTCDVCGCFSGHTESGWDIGLEEADMWGCINDHTICQDCIPEGMDDTTLIREILNNSPDLEYDARHSLLEKHCKICNEFILPVGALCNLYEKLTRTTADRDSCSEAEYISNATIFYGKSATDLKMKIKKTFKTYREFMIQMRTGNKDLLK